MSATLPTGTVTFLFTDIEGSTRLWEEHPQEMREALARHDALLREAVEEHGGVVFKTVGDAFCAAFASANDARMAAVHARAADQRGSDYFGPTVHRLYPPGGFRGIAVGELYREKVPGNAAYPETGRQNRRGATFAPAGQGP